MNSAYDLSDSQRRKRLFRSAFRHRADNAAPSPAGCGFAACARFHCVALHDGDALCGAGDGLFRAESHPAAPSGRVASFSRRRGAGRHAGRSGRRALFYDGHARIGHAAAKRAAVHADCAAVALFRPAEPHDCADESVPAAEFSRRAAGRAARLVPLLRRGTAGPDALFPFI